MLRMPVSRLALRSPLAGTGEVGRRSPVEIVATMGTYLTRTHAAEVSGLRAGPFGRWADGVTAMHADCIAFADLRALLTAVPDRTVVLDLPVPAGYAGLLGRAGRPYLTRINRTIHEVAAVRSLPVAEVSTHFLPPWSGKFASDCFHPSQDGYRDWTRALLAVL